MLKNNVVVFREVQNSYKEIFPKFQKIEKQLKVNIYYINIINGHLLY